VSGNHNHASQKFRGAIFVLNSGKTMSDPGVLRLYSGTYVQPEGNTQLAPVSTSFQGGLIEIFKDVTITGATGKYSLLLNTANNNPAASTKYDEVVNISGGTFNGPVHTERYLYSSINNTELNIYGGTFNDGIEIDELTTLNLSGSPVIKGAGLKIPEGVVITLETLEQGASILTDAVGVFTYANPLAGDYLQYFTPVKAGYEITVEDNIFSCNPVE